jgi:hypothetical protein
VSIRVQDNFQENAKICRLLGRGSFVWQATFQKKKKKKLLSIL